MRIQRLENGSFIASHHGVNINFKRVMRLGCDETSVYKLFNGINVAAVLGGTAARAFGAEFERLKAADSIGVN